MNLVTTDTSKSLQDIDGEDWGEPSFDSHVVHECHRVHRVPLCDLKSQDLARMLRQNLCLEHLLPLALDALRDNPFLDAEYYEGDLLCDLLRVDRSFWPKHAALCSKAQQLAEFAKQNLALLSSDSERGSVSEAVAQFDRNIEAVSMKNSAVIQSP